MPETQNADGFRSLVQAIHNQIRTDHREACSRSFFQVCATIRKHAQSFRMVEQLSAECDRCSRIIPRNKIANAVQIAQRHASDNYFPSHELSFRRASSTGTPPSLSHEASASSTACASNSRRIRSSSRVRCRPWQLYQSGAVGVPDRFERASDSMVGYRGLHRNFPMLNEDDRAHRVLAACSLVQVNPRNDPL